MSSMEARKRFMTAKVYGLSSFKAPQSGLKAI
jgi:hypothetical protein